MTPMELPMSSIRPLLAAIVAALALTSTTRADELAFVTLQSPANALAVYDVATMTQSALITGFGVEPSRMVANSDRSRLYLVSRILASGPQPAEMRVHIVSPAQRRILRTAVVGQATGRAIAISPDDARIYVWKLTTGPQSFGVAALDATTLDEIGFVPLPFSLCAPVARNLATAPDGRIVASGCADGLRVIEPTTLVSTTLSLDADLLNDLVGFAPGGQEVYVRRNGTSASASNPQIAAIDLSTGVRNNLAFVLEPSAPAVFGVPVRLVEVRRPMDPPGNPTVFITYAPTTGGAPPIASAPSSELTTMNRRLTRVTSLGTPSATIMGVSENGRVGVFGNQRILRRVTFNPAAPGEPIATDGDSVEVAPSGSSPLQLSDIVIAQPLLEDGFE